MAGLTCIVYGLTREGPFNTPLEEEEEEEEEEEDDDATYICVYIYIYIHTYIRTYTADPQSYSAVHSSR